MTNSKENALILLSGGLDSLVSTAVMQQKYNIVKALHFNYGQKPSNKEIEACKNICRHYNIELEILDLDWLGKLSQNSALNSENKTSSDIGADYWIPNRNGLFVNIAACYAESINCKFVAIGANIEEAQGFKDNSVEFVDRATELFAHSTQNNVEVIAPLIRLNKQQIIEKAIELDAPLELVWSCYEGGEKHCGKCPSCKLLKSALKANKKDHLQKLLF